MKLSTILLLPLLGATTTLAHHLLAEILIDGAAQGLGTCLRVPPNTNPLTDVTSQDMACNVAGSNKQSITCAANGIPPTLSQILRRKLTPPQPGPPSPFSGAPGPTAPKTSPSMSLTRVPAPCT